MFSHPKYKRAIFENSTSKWFSKYLIVDEKRHKICEPPVADMILWENKYKWTWLRVIFVWIITLAICFCSYLLVGLAQFQEGKLK